MAITPFTQPAQMGKFIPQQPRLPVDDIASATQNVYKQELAAKKRRNKLLSTAAEQKAAEADRSALQGLEQKLQSEFKNLASDDDLLFNDRERISELARFAKKELGKVERARKLRQKQQEQLENLSDASRRNIARKVVKSPSIKFDEETGRIDPDSLPSVIPFSEEADNLYDIGVEAIEGLKDRFLDEASGFGGTYEDMGLREFKEVSGISAGRIKKAVMQEFDNNSDVQNWKNNTLKMFKRKYQKEGVKNPSKKARRIVKRKLDTLATNIANNRASYDVNIDLESLPGSGEGGGSRYPKEIVMPGSPISEDHLPEGPYREEYNDRKERIRNEIRTTTFSDSELEKIRSLRRRAKQMANRVPEEGSDKTTSTPTSEHEFFAQRQYSTTEGDDKPPRTEQEFLTELMSGKTPQVRSEDAYFAQLMKNAKVNGEKKNLWDRYQTMQQNIEAKANSPEYAVNFYTPSGSQAKLDQKMEQMLTGVQNLAGKIKSEDILVQSEEDNSWLPFYRGSQTKENTTKTFRKVLENAKNASVSGDARWIRVTVDNSVEGDDNNRFEGRSFRIPTQNMTPEMIRPLTAMFSDNAREVIESNLRYRNTSITSDSPLKVGRDNNYQVSVSGNMDEETGQWKENFIIQRKGEDGSTEPVVYDDLISTEENTSDIIDSIVQYARQENLRGISDREIAIEALKNYKNYINNGEELNTYGEQLRQFLKDTTVSIENRGLAIEAATSLSRNE